MECIFSEYIKFVDNFLTDYYKMLFNDKYDRNVVRPFINKYIDVRYYNKSDVEEGSITSKLNKELNMIAKQLLSEHKNKAEKIKNVFALFSYVLFIDGCTHFSNLTTLLKTLFSDTNITLEYDSDTKKSVTTLIKKYISKKVEFFKLFSSGEFYLKGKKLDQNVYHIDLGQKCNLSKLYSEYAIDKAYNSEVVFENRTYLALIMLSSKILSEVLSLKFNNNYIIDFPDSLLDKPKKIVRFLRALDDELLTDKINIKFMYKDYKKYKKEINSLITDGYNIALELDETYTIDFDSLLLFNYILVDKKYNYYDNIINNKNDLKTKIISL